ncbi:MAG: AraC family transcriptional regulator [Treponema sp.]|nr:AraC family transcriptional regulator [Treponema sp.]
MEWTESLKRAISYMETHLFNDIDGYDVAEAVHISPFYFQKGFKLMTGWSIAEYIRYRRLYLAALDVIAADDRVIDIAYKYGYETPESFTKAFTRFHGVSPMQMKGDAHKIKLFLPLTISIVIQGGSEMDYKIEKMDAFKVIGYERDFSFEDAYRDIPEFWTEFMTNCLQHKNQEQIQSVIEKCMIGEFGVCIDDKPETKKFTYMIAGRYDGGTIPAGMRVLEIPAAQWAKFRCVGPLPGALQAVNTEIFKNWLPGNPDYEMSTPLNIEWYSKDDGSKPDYESEIWLPVKQK